MDEYVYPDELYCIKCDKDVEPVIESRTERLVRTICDKDVPVDASYKVALCPNCGDVLCDRDFDWAIVRIARKDGVMRKEED